MNFLLIIKTFGKIFSNNSNPYLLNYHKQFKCFIMIKKLKTG
jgi:hypothetical protein